LLLALGAVLILQFINPEILNLKFNFPELKKPEASPKYVNPAKEIDEKLFNQQKVKIQTKLTMMMKDGFQAGEGITLIQEGLLTVEFNRLTDKEILDNLKLQLLGDEGANQYKGFLDTIYNQKLIYEKDTKNAHFQEMKNINDLLNRYESLNEQLPYSKNVFIDAKTSYLNKKSEL
jgi:hypothetical protein